MASTVKRLEELLDLKDQQLVREQEANSELRRQLEYSVDWMLHERMTEGEDELPVPRIEMLLKDNSDFYVESQVSLVIRERGGSHSRVPLGYSRRSGGGVDVSSYPTTGEMGDRRAMDLPGLVNDACYYSEQTGIPAYVVLDDTHRYQVTSLRPLVLKAVE